MYRKDSKFDKEFEGAWRLILIGFAFTIIFSLSIWGFLLFAVYKILNHFGIM